jgi:hypothetical protein
MGKDSHLAVPVAQDGEQRRHTRRLHVVRGPERRHGQRQRRQGLRIFHRRPLGQPAVVVLCWCCVGERELASLVKLSGRWRSDPRSFWQRSSENTCGVERTQLGAMDDYGRAHCTHAALHE